MATTETTTFREFIAQGGFEIPPPERTSKNLKFRFLEDGEVLDVTVKISYEYESITYFADYGREEIMRESISIPVRLSKGKGPRHKREKLPPSQWSSVARKIKQELNELLLKEVDGFGLADEPVRIYTPSELDRALRDEQIERNKEYNRRYGGPPQDDIRDYLNPGWYD